MQKKKKKKKKKKNSENNLSVEIHNIRRILYFKKVKVGNVHEMAQSEIKKFPLQKPRWEITKLAIASDNCFSQNIFQFVWKTIGKNIFVSKYWPYVVLIGHAKSLKIGQQIKF